LALARLGHEVVVIAPSASAKDHVEHENNLTIFRLKSMSLKFSHPYFRAVMPVNVTKKVTKIINDFTPDLHSKVNAPPNY